MYKMKIIFLHFVLCFTLNSLTSTADAQIACKSDVCFNAAVAVMDKEKCEKKHDLSFYYDMKSGKCASSNCIEKYETFESEKECTDECKDCHKILKQYKHDDVCLHGLKLQPLKPNEKSQDLTKLWGFDPQTGKCSTFKGDFFKTASGSILTGVALPTEEECNKKCPSIH